MQLLEQNKRELQLITKSSKYHGETLSPLQVENLAKRIDVVASKSEKVLRKLDYEEAKCQLMSLVEELEAKMAMWNPEKHGNQAEVTRLHGDFQVRCITPRDIKRPISGQKLLWLTYTT